MIFLILYKKCVCFSLLPFFLYPDCAEATVLSRLSLSTSDPDDRLVHLLFRRLHNSVPKKMEVSNVLIDYEKT